jgi:hypothetical protein
MTLLIIDKQWPEPLENNDSGDYYWQSTVWVTRQPWQ